MLKRIVQAALLRRDPYLFMVLAVDGVADAAMIVGGTSAILALPVLTIDVLTFVRVILSGVVGWIILSGITYLIGKHLLEGYGSFQGTMAAVGIVYPVLLASLAFEVFLSFWVSYLLATVWLVLGVATAAKVALELDTDRALMAAAGGWVGLVIVQAIFRI